MLTSCICEMCERNLLIIFLSILITLLNDNPFNEDFIIVEIALLVKLQSRPNL